MLVSTDGKDVAHGEVGHQIDPSNEPTWLFLSFFYLWPNWKPLLLLRFLGPPWMCAKQKMYTDS